MGARLMDLGMRMRRVVSSKVIGKGRRERR